MVHKLRPEETVDVYLAELPRLSVLFGGMSEKGLTCAFIVGMPKSVEELLRASPQVDNMDISVVLARARAILWNKQRLHDHRRVRLTDNLL